MTTSTLYQHDNIAGIAVDDYIGGTDGNDDLVGTSARDMIIGFSGDDIITGGKGADIMFGGPRSFFDGVDQSYPFYPTDIHKDTFVFHDGDNGTGSANRDIIRGFEVGQDKIDLTSFGPDLHYAITEFGGKFLLSVDANHDGKWDNQVEIILGNQVHNMPHLTSADLLLA